MDPYALPRTRVVTATVTHVKLYEEVIVVMYTYTFWDLYFTVIQKLAKVYLNTKMRNEARRGEAR